MYYRLVKRYKVCLKYRRFGNSFLFFYCYNGCEYKQGKKEKAGKKVKSSIST